MTDGQSSKLVDKAKQYQNTTNQLIQWPCVAIVTGTMETLEGATKMEDFYIKYTVVIFVI